MNPSIERWREHMRITNGEYARSKRPLKEEGGSKSDKKVSLERKQPLRPTMP